MKQDGKDISERKSQKNDQVAKPSPAKKKKRDQSMMRTTPNTHSFSGHSLQASSQQILPFRARPPDQEQKTNAPATSSLSMNNHGRRATATLSVRNKCTSTFMSVDSEGTEGCTRYELSKESSLGNREISTPTSLQTTPENSEEMQLRFSKFNIEEYELLCNTTHTPPVTTDSLQELELIWVQNNVNLRVDLNFDYDLHFMPVSGRRREQKRFEAVQYWRCIVIEFEVYQHSASEGNSIYPQETSSLVFFASRLPVLFRELRKLLLVLVPERDRQEVELQMDIELLMQQVQHNALDIIRLSVWLIGLLKRHCAPLRDTMADDIAQTIEKGVQDGNMTTLVAGLEKLFSFCEVMKLDVANHQIRTFRVPLIEEGVSFQRDYFSIRLRNGKFQPRPSYEWFVSVKNMLEAKEWPAQQDSDVLIAGFVELCTTPEATIQQTLKHDAIRIRQIQEEVQDIIHLRMCSDVFRKENLNLPMNGVRRTDVERLLCVRIMDLTDSRTDAEQDDAEIWQSNVGSIAAEITRILAVARGEHQSQIPSGTFERISQVLSDRFLGERADPELASALGMQLYSQSLRYMADFARQSALSLSDMQKQYQQTRQENAKPRLMPSMEDISRRIAHMATIHWRVWADLVYTRGDFDVEQGFSAGSEKVCGMVTDTGDSSWTQHDKIDHTLCEHDI